MEFIRCDGLYFQKTKDMYHSVVIDLKSTVNYPKWGVLLWSFSLGLMVDIFSNTPGVAAASMTFVALLQPYLLEPFVPRDSADDLKVSVRSLGWGKFATLAFLLVLIYVLVFFSLEAFNFYNWQQWLMCVGGSTVLTYLFILVIENLRTK